MASIGWPESLGWLRDIAVKYFPDADEEGMGSSTDTKERLLPQISNVLDEIEGVMKRKPAASKAPTSNVETTSEQRRTPRMTVMTNKTGTSGVLAALAALSLAACTPGSGGGTTTIIQQPPAANSTPTTSTTSSVTPISDGAKLCGLLKGRSGEVIHAIDSFVKVLPEKGSGKGWNWDDSEISAKADHAKEVVDKDAPILEGSVSPNAPKDVADVVKDFVKISKDYAEALGNRYGSDIIFPIDDQFTGAVNKNKEVCHWS